MNIVLSVFKLEGKSNIYKAFTYHFHFHTVLNVYQVLLVGMLVLFLLLCAVNNFVHNMSMCPL